MSLIEGFDPLTENVSPDATERRMLEEATKRIIANILKSYTGYYDAFSEMIQNALDAVDLKRKASSQGYIAKVHIYVDVQSNSIRVVDNGVGMDLEQYKFCFRPNVSFKGRREGRGHKGVGATFLAYGFSMVRLQSKKGASQIAGVLREGRQWADDLGESYPRPAFREEPFNCPELLSEASGTSIEITIGQGQRPSLSWLQADTAEQWLNVLRIRTPLGGVYLSAPERREPVHIKVQVTDIRGNVTVEDTTNVDYYYPHEMPILSKVKDVSEILSKYESLTDTSSQRIRSLPEEYKRLDAVYEIWHKDQILSNRTLSRNLSEEDRVIIQRHNIVMYGCFLSSATYWAKFRDDILGIRKAANPLKGGLQLASDYMIQGDPLLIPLTSAIGYQANTHVIVHLTDGNPDMGRKVFQPEVKQLAEELAKRAVDIFKEFIPLMREETGVAPQTASKNLWNWKNQQEKHRESNPLRYTIGDLSLSLVSTPVSEQDVISLFHELLGMGVIRGYGIYATSQIEQYDCVYFRRKGKDLEFSMANRLGVCAASAADESEPLILEYKVSSDGLVADFARETKFAKDMSLLVCWEIGSSHEEQYSLRSLLIGDEGSTRANFGATHVVYRDRQPLFEILCLRDLVAFLEDSVSEEARQKAAYEN